MALIAIQDANRVYCMAFPVVKPYPLPLMNRVPIVILTLLLVACAPKVVAPVEPNHTMEPTTTLPIEVSFPKPNDTLNGTVTITGKARGTWYFEASFPMELLDSKGAVLLAMPAQADGEWMTEDWVPFSAEMTIPKKIGTKGTLVLKKDNPSGLPEHEAEIRIPVLFEQRVSRCSSLGQKNSYFWLGKNIIVHST